MKFPSLLSLKFLDFCQLIACAAAFLLLFFKSTMTLSKVETLSVEALSVFTILTSLTS